MFDRFTDAATLVVSVAFMLALASAPAFIALERGTRTSKDGFDLGPRNNLVAVGLSVLVVFLLMCLFSYLYTSSSPWTDWLD